MITVAQCCSYNDDSTGTNPCLDFFPGQSNPGQSGQPGQPATQPPVIDTPSGPSQPADGGDSGADVGARPTPGIY